MCPACQMRLAINAHCPRCRDTNGPCIYCMSCANLLQVGRRIRMQATTRDQFGNPAGMIMYYECVPAIAAPTGKDSPMPHDLMHARMLRARAQQAEEDRRERLNQLSAEPKPRPDTVLSIEEADLLAQAHHYAEGEVIGLKRLGGYSDSHQVLWYVNGNVVADARFDRVLNPHDPSVPVGTPTGWSVQAGRRIGRDEVA
jgi:hypothetical protein